MKKIKSRFYQVFPVTVAIVLFIPCLWGQTARFTGRVADPSGAVVPRATITIHNVGTGENIKTVTTTAGDYTVPYMKPGVYAITAQSAGFKASTKTDITLSVDQVCTVNFALQVGATTDSVVVTADESQVEFAKADRGEIIEGKRIEEMPLNSRNPLMLVFLSPGLYNSGEAQWQRPFDEVNRNITINNGGSPILTVDGMANNMMTGAMGYVPPVDSVQEFKVVLNPLDASYGHGTGGAIDMQFKSGTKQYHGDVYEYMRRSFLDANSWQNNANNRRRPNHYQDQYGFELDGPVHIPHLYKGRNNTFFLMQFENYREALPDISAYVNTVPDQAWLRPDGSADLSQLRYYNTKTNSLQPLIIYDPLSPLTAIVDPNDGKTKQMHSPFPGNLIPANRISPVGAALFRHFPKANSPGSTSGLVPPYQDNLYNLAVEHDTYRNAIVKIDHNIGDKDRLSFRWSWQGRWAVKEERGIPPDNPATDQWQQTQPHDTAGSINWVHTFSPSVILENRLTGINWTRGQVQGPTGTPLTDFGFSSTFSNMVGFWQKFPYVTTSGFLQLGPRVASLGYKQANHTVQYAPSITVVRGQHSVRAGIDMRFQQTGYSKSNGGLVSFDLTSGWTSEFYNAGDAPGYNSGSALASLLLGYANSGTVSSNILPFKSQHYYSAWVQDDWKATSKLTLNLGLRYDYVPPLTERFDRMTYFFNTSVVNPASSDPNFNVAANGGRPILGGVEFADVNGNPRGVFHVNNHLFQPRIGFAYAIDNKTSLRAGVGLMYSTNEASGSDSTFSSSTSYVNSLDNGLTPLNNLATNPYPQGLNPAPGASGGYLTFLGRGYSFLDPNYTTSQFWQMSFTLQRQLTHADMIEVGFQGSRNKNMGSVRNLNPISAALQAQCDVERGGNRHLCDDKATGQVTNPFYQVAGFKGTGYYSNKTISLLDMSRPFRGWGDLNETVNSPMHHWYNSLQVIYNRRWDKNLTMHATWTYSKNMQAGNIIDQINGIRGRSLSGIDQTHRITFSGVYMLPVGRGRRLFRNTNPIIDGVIGGWEISPMYVYQMGTPWWPSGNWELMTGNLAAAGNELPPDSTHQYTRIQGVTPCVAYKDSDTGNLIYAPTYIAAGCTAPALVRAPNGYAVARNVEFTGVHKPATYFFDVNFSKNFALTEVFKMQLRLDAFNLLNHPNWGSNYNSDPTSPYFGSFTKGPKDSPNNPPRYVQISAKVSW